MSNPAKAQTSGLNVKQLALTGLMTAVLCILGPLSLNIPISPVPISLGFLGIYFLCSVLGMKLGTLSVITYILLGLAGLPVFTGFAGGPQKLFGPTGGYIIGYVPMVVLAGLALKAFPQKRWFQLGGMILATAVLYAFGTILFCAQTGSTLERALLVCVIPFIPFDFGKMFLATALGPILRERLIQANIHPEG